MGGKFLKPNDCIDFFQKGGINSHPTRTWDLETEGLGAKVIPEMQIMPHGVMLFQTSVP